jgi:hypothetical protein
VIKLSELGASPARHAPGLLDERLPATRRGDGKSARAFSQVGAQVQAGSGCRRKDGRAGRCIVTGDKASHWSTVAVVVAVAAVAAVAQLHVDELIQPF